MGILLSKKRIDKFKITLGSFFVMMPIYKGEINWLIFRENFG